MHVAYGRLRQQHVFIGNIVGGLLRNIEGSLRGIFIGISIFIAGLIKTGIVGVRFFEIIIISIISVLQLFGEADGGPQRKQDHGSGQGRADHFHVAGINGNAG